MKTYPHLRRRFVSRQWQPALMFSFEILGGFLVLYGMSNDELDLSKAGLMVTAFCALGVWVTPDLPDIPRA
jgi:hypothetical protein